MIALALDASTYSGTVAVIRDGQVMAAAEAAMRGEHEERLMPAVAAVLRQARVEVADLDTVACGAGPGSFTSLRIAASIAKGIAFAREIPLRAVSSLVLVAAGAEPPLAVGRYLAVLDALRGEVYAQLVEVGVAGAAPLDVWRLVAADAVEAVAGELSAVVVGPGATLRAQPHARGFARLARGVEGAAPVDAASWEPDYGRLAEAQVRWEAAHGRPLHSALAGDGARDGRAAAEAAGESG
ncbi:MAG TPA: tRNA (adenosine(37)-N6)-threonylcarbamoyltransferase complex dimerization subunit type 1 TsaB [Gemmatimonadaceae bacterium]|nr:tRNA (adenosine(37)-N6)-threonylcarbamoyltransferase complex dimerization subunit type 1 TsaB [Gemmatimonadaceae bacterium]